MVIMHTITRVIRYIYLVTNQIHRDAYHHHLISIYPYKATVQSAARLGDVLV